MKVVCNTSPIINLAAVGELELLKKIYGKVIIPGAVYFEITGKGSGQPGDIEVRTFDWIEILEVKNNALLKTFLMDLHPGEAEAIILAKETNSDLLIIDEQKARKVASTLDIRFIGLLGILMKAKRQGYIRKVKPIMDSLMYDVGFWIDRELYRYVLETANE